jgi:hypothetical protein
MTVGMSSEIKRSVDADLLSVGDVLRITVASTRTSARAARDVESQR